MNLKNILKNKYSFNIAILTIILSLVFTYIYLYHTNNRKELRKAIIEHSQLLAEPMWSFDTNKVINYISILSARKEYLQIKTLDENNIVTQQTERKELEGLDKILFKMKLLPINQLDADIIINSVYLGKITVLWKETCIYYYSYATLIGLLLYAISALYYSASVANRKLISYVSELRKALQEVRKQKEYIESVYQVVPAGLITFDENQNPVDWNSSYDAIITTWAEDLGKDKKEIHGYFLERLLKELKNNDKGEFFIELDGNNISLSYESSQVSGFDTLKMIISIYDRTDTANMRRRLLHSEKLESVGRLAAGIAHEINTPTQYVVTNIDFLAGAFDDVNELIGELESLNQTKEPVKPEDAATFESILKDADWDYLSTEIPDAIQQSVDGLQRIRSIVSAMKTFSHPSGDSPELCDINQAIQATATVARNEWKYFAELELNFAEDLPQVPCFLDHFNQVILNMIINAVHAIEDQLHITGEEKGTITICTQQAEDYAEIRISDTGVGMNKELQNKVLDPFFTTKGVNKGTGQGLTIANDIIVNKHNGRLIIESEPGRGTTFIISLPYQN